MSRMYEGNGDDNIIQFVDWLPPEKAGLECNQISPSPRGVA